MLALRKLDDGEMVEVADNQRKAKMFHNVFFYNDPGPAEPDDGGNSREPVF